MSTQDFSKATPRPWTVKDDPVNPERGAVYIEGPNGWRVQAIAECDVGDHDREANAALIVHAVNHHDALVEALTELVGILNDAIANGSLEGTTCEAPAAVAVTAAEALLKSSVTQQGE